MTFKFIIRSFISRSFSTSMASLPGAQQIFNRLNPPKSHLLMGVGKHRGSPSERTKLQIRCLNTFLPYQEFDRTVECLDNRRLGKQRVEAWQILRIVQASPVPVKGTAWANSPAVRMWRGFPDALVVYYNACLKEWERRGFKNVILQPLESQLLPVVLPPWLGDELVHASHRSNLLRKEPAHYKQFGWTEPPDLPYMWPVPMVKAVETKVVKKSLKKKSARFEAVVNTQEYAKVVATDGEEVQEGSWV